MTQDWPHIRGILSKWMAGTLVVAAYFIVANLTCGGGRCGQATLSTLGLTGLGAIVFVCVQAAIRLSRAETLLLFTPVISFAAASALFFGFGPMVTFLGSEVTRQFQAYSTYAVTGEEVLGTSLLTCIGLAATIMGILLALPRFRSVRTRSPLLSLRAVAIIFLVTGLILKHLIIMPSIYGTSSFLVPGTLRNLRYLPDLGFALVAMIAATGDRRFALLFWLIWPLHLLLAFPEFSKKSVVLTMLLPALGGFVVHRSYLRLFPWVLSLLVIFSALQNTNTIARWSELEAAEYGEVLGIRERMEILGDLTFTNQELDIHLPAVLVGVEMWWLRLNYSGAQTAAMELYDSGQPGTFTQNPLIYFLPRFIWPDKPILASPGLEFHAAARGSSNTETRVGASIYGDGYWQMGWTGVVLFGLVFGLVMGLLTRLTINQLGRGRFLYLPAAMMTLQIGALAPTTFLQSGVIAGLPIYFAYCGLIVVMYRIIGKLAVQQKSFIGSAGHGLPEPAR
ncbi:hypothetical protein [Citreimonas salinaria]|uniref:Oligosaccharide repeat unit polymerase n=1 Tax=Citreimonas salinaria TaxID=321339 RepID=A0A1H3F1B3_9RHOB|nr:hypothetical protein [Citreimonas salinaria]SDX84108.1 hypothetical protein SAMN05444340_10187 [Citreimonas salinaria]